MGRYISCQAEAIEKIDFSSSAYSVNISQSDIVKRTKKFKILIFLAFSLIFGLAGCGTVHRTDSDSTPPVASSVQMNVETYPKTYYDENPDKMEQLKTEYLAPAFSAGMLYTSWDNAENIDPDYFPAYYTTLIQRNHVPSEYPFDEKNDPMVPAAEFEKNIQNYFNVTTKHLRDSKYYNPDTKTYSFVGLGGASDCKVTSAQKDKQHFILEYELILDGLLVTHTGTLTIKFEADSGYKYASNQVAENPQVQTKAGQFIINTGFYEYSEIILQAYAVFHHNRSGYDSAALLHSDDLFNFFLTYYETPEDFYQKSTDNYIFPISAITDLLDNYFEGYTFDMNAVTYNIVVQDDMVTLSGFSGKDSIKSQIKVTAVSVVGEDQLRIDADLMDLDDPEKVSSTTNVVIRVTDAGYHILSLGI